MYTHRMAVSHVRSMSFLVEIVTVTRKNIDEPRNLMVCDFTMSIYKNRLPSRSIELNYATWRDEYTRRFFHGGNDTARQFIKFHTRPWQGVSSTDTARSIARANPSKIMRDVFYGPKIAACVRRPLCSAENNFFIRENGLKSADGIEFIVPLARLSREIFPFFSRTRDIRSIFRYCIIL